MGSKLTFGETQKYKACLSSKCDVKVACTETMYNMPKGTVDNGSVYMYR